MAHTSMSAFGNRQNVEAAKASGAIDSYDILYLDGGETGWIDASGETVIATSKLQEDIFVNGVDGLGVDDGEVIPSGKSVDDIVRMLVRKAIPAVYYRPHIFLSSNDGFAFGDVEAGSSFVPNMRASFVQNDAGELIDILIQSGDNIVASGITPTIDYIGEPTIIGDDTIMFGASAMHGAAMIKTDNLGNESTENWFDSGITVSESQYVSGKRNMFYGTGIGDVPELTSSVVRNLPNKKLSPKQDYSFDVHVDIGQQYIIIAYPDTIRDISNVTYIGTNDTMMVQNFTKTIIDVADARGEENGLMPYKVYTYAMKIPAAAPMIFNITI